MFRLKQATTLEIDRAVQQVFAGGTGLQLLDPLQGLQVSSLPEGFSHDRSCTCIGNGLHTFQAAVRAFERWRQFDLGWVRVANQTAAIEVGQVVAVEVNSIGLWSLNLSRIVSVTRDPRAFGFIYKTTSKHVEEGEERFLLTIDSSSEDVRYELEAVSKPRYWMARLGYPMTRSFQHRFARNSHQHMRMAVSEGDH